MSVERAWLLHEWQSISENAKNEQKPIYLDYEDCLEFFQKTEENEHKFDTFFQNNKKIQIIYEELCSDTSGTMTRVLDFLGVPYRVLETNLRKQNLLSLQESVQNYWELKDQFKHTDWVDFFED